MNKFKWINTEFLFTICGHSNFCCLLINDNYEGYVKVGDLTNNDSIEMTLDSGTDINVVSAGRYRVDGFADFAHSVNGSTIGFVFAVE